MSTHPNRRAVLTSIALVILVAIGAATAHGQVAVGDTLRFGIGRHKVSGVLVELDSTSVVIRNDDGDMSYPRANVGDLEVLHGHHRAGLASVGNGAAIGLASGLALAALSEQSDRSSANREMAGLGFLIGATLGTATGTVVGGILAFHQVDDWRPAYLAPSTGAIAAQREVTPGDVIRFSGPIRVDEAALVAIAPAKLVVQPVGDARQLTVPAAEMVDPEVRRGYRPLGMRAVAVGALAGAGLGLLYGLRPHETGGLGTGHPVEAIPVLVGLVNGTVIGLAVSAIPVPNWRPFDAARAAAP